MAETRSEVSESGVGGDGDGAARWRWSGEVEMERTRRRRGSSAQTIQAITIAKPPGRKSQDVAREVVLLLSKGNPETQLMVKGLGAHEKKLPVWFPSTTGFGF